MEPITIALMITIGVIEVVTRTIPSTQNWAPLAIALRVLTAISEYLNRSKKSK